MKDILSEISSMVRMFGSSPTLEEMPRRTLLDKGIAGPTAAHVIEEVHTPLNLAYLTFTSGSSAFQNIVGITHEELALRKEAAFRIFKLAGLKQDDKVLVTYPPLVNVFSGDAFKEYGLQCEFLIRSSRDAFLVSLCEEQPVAIIGESSFLRVALEDAKKMGLVDLLPKRVNILTAGTPLDLELLPIAEEVLNAQVFDLYGCQEFGWLCCNGVPVRDDITLVKSSSKKEQDFFEVVVGGLPTGDSFPVSNNGHICNSDGKIITYRRERTYPEYEVVVRATTLSSATTIQRVARSILRIKGRIVKVSPHVKVNSEETVLELCLDPYAMESSNDQIIIQGKDKTKLFDDLVSSQVNYQQKAKKDPTWIKRK
ncbi:AMP-binding protein [uncultured Veillonella sp.]|uniref:AMP-binding protein n=1 Tax=uncultured Veillonella sp. TaxID=159268 RepID=UPI0025D0625F|nr:AMP-binding protein [uncultured Veillonella sp.]MDY3973198.1 AMP-binding protein [Veillonella caviae]